MSILSYFQPIDEALYEEVLHSSTGEVSTTQVCVSRELNQMMVKKSKKKTSQTVREDVKRKVGFRANKYGIPAAREWAKKTFRQYEFKRETVRDWRNKYREAYVNNLETSSQNAVLVCCRR